MADPRRPRLLQVARDRVTARVLRLSPPALPRDGGLLDTAGVFVTLWLRGELRGCIGLLEPDGPLADATARMAEQALLDPRFPEMRLLPQDLADLRIEVSVLGPLRPIAGPADIVTGRDGVVLHAGGRSGCFLPKVAAEHGWSPTETLDQLCRHKLGLPAGAWRLPGSLLFAFTAASAVEQAAPAPS